MKKLISAVIAIGFIVVPAASLAQISGPPTLEQIQQLMQQAGAPAGMQVGPPAGVAEMQNKGFKLLKKSAKNMQKAVAQMEKAVDGATKAGFPPSQEVIDAVVKGKAAVQLIVDAAEFTEEVQDAIDQFNDFTEVLDANIEALNMLKNFPRIQKQAQREIANTDKAFAKVKAKLENAEMDLSEILADIQSKITLSKTTYDNAINAAKSGKPEEAFSILENDFFPAVGDIRQSIGMLDAIKNISRAVKSVDKGIKSAEKVVAKLQKKGLDPSALNIIIADSKAELDDLKAALRLPAKDFDPTSAVDYLESLNDLRDQFESTLDQITDNENVGTLPQVNFFTATMPKIPNFNVGNNGFGIEKIEVGF